MRRIRFSIPAIIALAAVTLFLGASTPAGAADRGTFTLTDVSQTASWSGELQAGPPVLPDVCLVSADACDVVKVDVQLPEGVWAQPGGMLVATQPPPEFTNLNDFDLYVYGPDGRQFAKADSQWSVGSHAAWVENPADGLYIVVVAPVLFGDPPAHYDGFVSFDRGLTVKRDELRDGQRYTQTFVAFGLASPAPAVELLPDLVPITPRNFHIETGSCLNFSLCNNVVVHQPSCYPEETGGQTSHAVPPGPGPLRCLRFDQGEDNVGDGPFELHMYTGEGNEVYQRVYSSDGSVSQGLIGEAVFHPNHAHFHYTSGGGWWDIKLHKRLANGDPGEIVASYTDKGICPLDVENGRFGQRRDGPQGYGNDDFNTCDTPRHQDPNDPTFPNAQYIQAGIAVGWTDVYPWFVKDQYIDITNVPDGKYVIVTKQDPGQRLIEKSRANNTAMACVEFSGTTATAQPCPSAPTPVPTVAKVTGGGQITGDPIFSALGDLISSPAAILSAGGTDNANFGFVVEDGSPPSGNLQYHDHGTGDVIKVTSIIVLSITAGACGPDTHASFTGTATVNGVPDRPFAVEVDDCGEPGTGDMFGITTTGYTNGPKTLLGGNIQVHQ